MHLRKYLVRAVILDEARPPMHMSVAASSRKAAERVAIWVSQGQEFATAYIDRVAYSGRMLQSDIRRFYPIIEGVK